ncbi:hypothetical protein AYO20_11449 [Fonsecaea nubica]|uniref:Uncharacterized protein n=1 Tax=Fonsecaea nubica TaxID=856822 RepID=A0A178BVJ2_9EURO|nr:hypothetical protein AYO20_11449 [Fonsecaea nubica]OAL20922.1 hypothetical protein AYO20_11449 [Fonsecaea nubica]
MDFGGPMYDKASRNWPTTYLVSNDGSVDEAIHPATFHTPGDRDSEASRKAFSAIQAVTLAAGKIHVTICRCQHPGRNPPPSSLNGILLSHDSVYHQIVEVSGFWLEGFKFVTAAHFLSCNHPLSAEEKKDTVDFLKYLSPLSSTPSTSAMRARVSCELSSRYHGHYEQGANQLRVPQIFDVQLTALNEAADVAIFKLAAHETRRPQTWIKNSQLSSAGANFPNTVASKIFSTYYPGADNLLSTDTKAKEHCSTQFELLVKSRLQLGLLIGDASDKVSPPRFNDIFHANVRSIGFGDLANASPEGDPGHGTVVRTHTIPGFSGCSGGMIGCLETIHCPIFEGSVVSNLSVRIIGIFKGEEFFQNTFSAFTQCGVDSIINC